MPFDKNMKVQNPNPSKHSSISILTLINYANDSSYQFQKQAIDILDSLRKQGIVDDHEIEKAKKTEKESVKDRLGEDGAKQDDIIMELSDGTQLTKDILNTPDKLKIVEQNKDNLNFLPLIQYIDEEHLSKFVSSNAPQIRRAVAEKIPIEQLNMFYGETVDTVLDVVAERISAVDGDKLLKKNNNLTFDQTEKIIKKVNEFNDFAKELQDAKKITPDLFSRINKLDGSDFDYAMEQIRPKLVKDKDFKFTKMMDPKKLTKFFSDEVETDSQWNPDYEINQEDRTGKVKVYRGGAFKNGRGYVSLEPGFALEFGDTDEWEIDKEKVLDLTNPVHRTQVQARFGDEVLNQLSPNNELPSAGDGNILSKLEKVSKSLGFIASAQSEGEGLPSSFDVYDTNQLNFPTPERVNRKSMFGSSPAEVEESLNAIAKNNYEGLLDIATEANDEENPLFNSNPKLREKIASTLKPEDVPIFADDTNSEVRMQVAKKIAPKLASEYGSSETDPDVLAEYILKMHEKDVTDSMMYHESNVVRRAVSEIIESPVLLERALKNEVTYDRADFTTLYNVVDKFKPEQIKSIVYPLYEKTNNWDLRNVIAKTITPEKIKNEQEFSNYSDFIKPGTDFKILSNLAKVVPSEVGSKYFNEETVQKIFDTKRSSDIDISSFVKELLPKQEINDVIQNVNKYVDYIVKYGGNDVMQAVTNSELIKKFKDADRLDDYNDMLDSIISYSDNPMIPKYSHTPIKVEDTDEVYVYRTISQAELDNVLNGQNTGEFWTSAPQSYPVGSRGKYRIVAKSEGKGANWLGGYLRPENSQYTVKYEGLNAVRTKNDNYKSPSKQKNHFEEIGSKNTSSIVAIYDANGNEVYSNKKESDKDFSSTKYQIIEDNENRVITYGQAENIIRKYFSEDEIDIKKSMRLFVENRAFGSYVNSVISFIENPDISTPYHESVHAYLDNFYTYDEKQDIYDAIREKDSKEYSDKEAEEKLADLFYPYVKGKETVTGKLKDYFDKAINFIKSLVGKEDKIKKLFNDIEKGKRPASNVKDVTVNPLLQIQKEYYQTPKYLTTKLFKMVETQKEFMSKQEISDLIKSKRANLKKPEKELLSRVLHDNFRLDGKIKVEDFENAVIQNLLPLNRKVSSKYATYGMEHLGGSWANSAEADTHIYESPEPNGVGGHFDDETKSLFGHTIIWNSENVDYMAEIQSDYFQKYRDALHKNPELMPFKNTWHERMIREEIRNSAVKGSESLRFPHPFTVAVIEGYVSGKAPYSTDSGDDYVGHGTQITYLGRDYVAIELMDGEFTAVPTDFIQEHIGVKEEYKNSIYDSFVDAVKDNGFNKLEFINSVEEIPTEAFQSADGKLYTIDKSGDWSSNDEYIVDEDAIEKYNEFVETQNNFTKQLKTNIIELEKLNFRNFVKELSGKSIKQLTDKEYDNYRQSYIIKSGFDVELGFFSHWDWADIDLNKYKTEIDGALGDIVDVDKAKEYFENKYGDLISFDDESGYGSDDIYAVILKEGYNRESESLKMPHMYGDGEGMNPNHYVQDIVERYTKYNKKVNLLKNKSEVSNRDDIPVNKIVSFDYTYNFYPKVNVNNYKTDKKTGETIHMEPEESISVYNEWIKDLPSHEIEARIKLIPGKISDQEHVILFYENQVLPYIKSLRNDVKKVTDDSGNVWFETKLTNEDRGAVEAFKEFAPAFYSRLEREVEGIEGENIKVQRLPNLLRNISQDEIKWSGLNDFVKDNAVNGKISKKAILDYLKENNTKVSLNFGVKYANMDKENRLSDREVTRIKFTKETEDDFSRILLNRKSTNKEEQQEYLDLIYKYDGRDDNIIMDFLTNKTLSNENFNKVFESIKDEWFGNDNTVIGYKANALDLISSLGTKTIDEPIVKFVSDYIADSDDVYLRNNTAFTHYFLGSQKIPDATFDKLYNKYSTDSYLMNTKGLAQNPNKTPEQTQKLYDLYKNTKQLALNGDNESKIRECDEYIEHLAMGGIPDSIFDDIMGDDKILAVNQIKELEKLNFDTNRKYRSTIETGVLKGDELKQYVSEQTDIVQQRLDQIKELKKTVGTFGANFAHLLTKSKNLTDYQLRKLMDFPFSTHDIRKNLSATSKMSDEVFDTFLSSGYETFLAQNKNLTDNQVSTVIDSLMDLKYKQNQFTDYVGMYLSKINLTEDNAKKLVDFVIEHTIEPENLRTTFTNLLNTSTISDDVFGKIYHRINPEDISVYNNLTDKQMDKLSDYYWADYSEKSTRQNYVYDFNRTDDYLDMDADEQPDHRYIPSQYVEGVVSSNKSESYSPDTVHFGEQEDSVSWFRGQIFNIDNEKIFHIDEIQSKRHDKAKELGYTSDVKFERDETDEYESYYANYKKSRLAVQKRQYIDEGDYRKFTASFDGRFVGYFATPDLAMDKLRRLTTAIPSAPFEEYAPITVKNILRYCAENQIDSIALTTPKQVKSLYNLSEHVAKITSIDNGDGTFRLSFYDEFGRRVFDEEGYSAVTKERMSELIGDSVADRIANNQGKKTKPEFLEVSKNTPPFYYKDKWVRVDKVDTTIDGKTVLSIHDVREGFTFNIDESEYNEYALFPVEYIEDDLEVGGEWADEFYGKSIPNFINKYLKKLGVKTQIVYKDVIGKGIVQPYIEIKGELTNKVLAEGQALFQKNPYQPMIDEMIKNTSKEDLSKYFDHKNEYVREGIAKVANPSDLHLLLGDDSPIVRDTLYGRVSLDEMITLYEKDEFVNSIPALRNRMAEEMLKDGFDPAYLYRFTNSKDKLLSEVAQSVDFSDKKSIMRGAEKLKDINDMFGERGEEEVDETEFKLENAVNKSKEMPKEVDKFYSDPDMVNIQNPNMEAGYSELSSEVKKDIAEDSISTNGTTEAYQLKSMLDAVGFVRTDREQELKENINDKSKWKRIEGKNHTVKLSNRELDHFKIVNNALIGIKDIVGDDIHLVGGATRDLLMRNANITNKEVNDLDFSVPKYEQIEKLNEYFKSHPEFGVDESGLKFSHIKVIHKASKYEFEFSSYRKEAYHDTSRKPDVVEGTFEDELKRRDFTINTIYAKIDDVTDDGVQLTIDDKTSEFIDDINKGIIRTYNDPNIVFDEDPLRLLRALRFASRYGFEIDEVTKESITNFDPAKFGKVSGERIRDEFTKVLRAGDDVFAFNIVAKVFPELSELYDQSEVLNHINRVVKLARKYDDNVLLWTALLHDVGKAKTAKEGKPGEDGKPKVIHPGHAEESLKMIKPLLNRLKLSRQEQKSIEKLVGIHSKYKELDKMNMGKVIDFAIENESVFPYLIKFQDLDYFAHAGSFFNDYPEETNFNIIARMSGVYNLLKEIPSEEKAKWQGKEFKSKLKNYIANDLKYKESYEAGAKALYKLYGRKEPVMPDEYLAPNNKPSKLTNYQWKQVRTPEFNEFFGDWVKDPKTASKVVDDNGEPKVVLHGTTFDISEFSTESANMSNYFGKAIYFSDSAIDVNKNYAGIGPDLQHKIDSAYENIYGVLTDELYEDSEYFIEQYPLTNEEDINKYNMLKDTSNADNRTKLFDLLTNHAEQVATKMAEDSVKGNNDGNIMPVYLDIKNPAIIDYLNPSRNTKFYLESEEDEDGNIVDTGNAVELSDAILELSPDFNIDGNSLWYDLTNNFMGSFYNGVTLENIDKAIRESSFVMDAYDEEGNNLVSEFIRQLYEQLGYDGIIQSNVDRKFVGMNLPAKTNHYMAFKPTQVKSAIANKGTFDKSGNILHQGKSEETDGVKPLSISELDDYSKKAYEMLQGIIPVTLEEMDRDNGKAVLNGLKSILAIDPRTANEGTFYHETFHIATEVLGDNKVWDVMLMQAGWDGEEKNDSWIEAQEKLADEFMKYVAEQKYKSKPVQLFDRLRTFFSKIAGIFSKDKQYYKADYFYKLSKGKLAPKTIYDKDQSNYSVVSNIAYQRNNSVPGSIKDKMIKTTLKSLGKNPSGKEILRGQGGMLNFNEDFFKHLKSDGVGRNEQEFIKFVIDAEKLADKKMSPEQFKHTLLSYMYPINIENSYEKIKVGMPDELYREYADLDKNTKNIKVLYNNYQYENGKYYGYDGWGEDREELKENQVPDEIVDMLLSKWETARYTNYYGSGGSDIGLQAKGGVGYRELKMTLPFDVLESHPEFATNNMLGWYRVDTDATNSRRLRVNELQSDVFQKNNIPKEYKNLVVGDTFKYEGRNVVVDGIYDGDNYTHSHLSVINKQTGNKLTIREVEYDDFREFGIHRAKHSMLIKNLQSNWHEYFIKSMVQNAYDSNFDEIMFPTGDTIGKIEGFTDFDEQIKKSNDRIESAESNKNESGNLQQLLVHRDREGLEKIDFFNLKIGFEDAVISIDGNVNAFDTKEQFINFLLDAKYTEQLIKQIEYGIIEFEDVIKSEKRSLEHYEGAKQHMNSVKDFYDKKVASYVKKLKKGNVEDYTDAEGQTWLLAKLDVNDGSPVELYQRKSFTKMFRLSMNGIKSVFENYIGGNVDYKYHWNRWFIDKDASSKPDVAHSILSNPELKNALVNNLFQSYKKMMEERTKILQDNPEAGLDVEDVADLTFEDFINKDIKVYREKSADKDLDGFDSWYLDRNVAIRNGNSDDIEEAVIKPSNTLGLMDNMHNNSQVLVPSGFTDEMYKDFSMSMMVNTGEGGVDISKDKLVEKFNKEKDWKNLYDRMIDIIYGKQQLNIGITPATKNIEEIGVLLQKSEEFFKKNNFNKVKEYNSKVLEFGKTWFDQKFQNKINAVVDVSDSIGLFGGWMEPTMDMNISFDYMDKGDVLSSIIDFADDFKQSNVHVSKRLVSIPETAEIGVVNSDGSTFQENYQVNFKKPLTKMQINNLTKKFDEFKLPGFTINEKNDSIVFYNITTDGVKGYEQFWEGTGKLFNYVESLPIFESKEQDFRQLWNWGDTEFGATAGFEEARSQVFSKPKKEDITLEKNFISEIDRLTNITDRTEIGMSTKVKVSANTEFEITPMGNKQIGLAVYSNGNYIGEEFLFEKNINEFKETFNKIAEKKHEILNKIQTEEPDREFPFVDELKPDSFVFVDGNMFYVDAIDDKKNITLCEIGNDGVLLNRKEVTKGTWEQKFSGIKVAQNKSSVMNSKSFEEMTVDDSIFLPTVSETVKVVKKDNYGVDCVTPEGRKVNISNLSINKMSTLAKLSENIESKIPDIHFGESDYTVTSLLNDKPYRMLPTFGSGAGNVSYFCSDAEGNKLALFKPSATETTSQHHLGIKPGTQFVREVVSSYVDKIFGFNIVPTTVFKKVNGMIGSYQKFVNKSVSMAEYVDSKFDDVRIELDRQAENMSKGLGVSLGSHMDEIIKDKNNNLIIDDMIVEFGLQMTPELRSTLSQSLDRLKSKSKSAQKKIRSDFQKSENYIKLYLLDYVIGNGDRHSENVLIDKDDNIHAIDNGYSLADNRGLSWFKDGMYVGMEEIMNLRESEHEGVKTLWKNLTNPKNMEKIKEKFVDTGILGGDEFKGLLSRVANMVRADGVFYTYVDESPRSNTIDGINMASTDYAEYTVDEALTEFTKMLD